MIAEDDIEIWNIGEDYGISIEYLKDESILGYHPCSKQEAEQLKQEILWALRLKEKIEIMVSRLKKEIHTCSETMERFDTENKAEKMLYDAWRVTLEDTYNTLNKWKGLLESTKSQY